MPTPKTVCPKHGGITPAHPVCHSHVSVTQQGCHNLHCRVLRCPHALRGFARYDEVVKLPPRNFLERLLLKLDPFVQYLRRLVH